MTRKGQAVSHSYWKSRLVSGDILAGARFWKACELGGRELYFLRTWGRGNALNWEQVQINGRSVNACLQKKLMSRVWPGLGKDECACVRGRPGRDHCEILNNAFLKNKCILWVKDYSKNWNLHEFLFFFLSFQGLTQARGQFGAVATGLHHSHSNTRSELRLWSTPQLIATPDP